jgi:hypothetical protein
MEDDDIDIDFVRQHSCKVRYGFDRMTKHLDGKNMEVDSFLHSTGMFSVLLVKEKKVYRLTNIAYTRYICYRWILKNRLFKSAAIIQSKIESF